MKLKILKCLNWCLLINMLSLKYKWPFSGRSKKSDIEIDNQLVQKVRQTYIDHCYNLTYQVFTTSVWYAVFILIQPIIIEPDQVLCLAEGTNFLNSIANTTKRYFQKISIIGYPTVFTPKAVLGLAFIQKHKPDQKTRIISNNGQIEKDNDYFWIPKDQELTLFKGLHLMCLFLMGTYTFHSLVDLGIHGHMLYSNNIRVITTQIRINTPFDQNVRK